MGRRPRLVFIGSSGGGCGSGLGQRCLIASTSLLIDEAILAVRGRGHPLVLGRAVEAYASRLGLRVTNQIYF